MLLHCFGCHAPVEEIADRFGLTVSDLFDEQLPERDRAFGRVGKSPESRRAARRRGHLGRLPERIASAPPKDEHDHVWVEVERYPYVDSAGSLVHEVIRKECNADGQRHKEFFQSYVTAAGGRASRKPPNFSPVLYRHPQVCAAVEAQQEIRLLEGEKDVHTAERLGLTATTNAQGGGSFPDELVDCVAQGRLAVVLDRDATGWARGVDLHRKLTGAGADVVLQIPAVDKPKADFTDHIEAGYTLDELITVHVAEVETWHQLTPAVKKSDQLVAAVAEVEAHMALASGPQQEAEEHRQSAARWVMEAQICHEALRDLVDKVHGQGLRTGTVWVGEAMLLADQLLASGTDAVRRVHHDVGVAVPPSLRPAAAASVAEGGTDGIAGGGQPPVPRIGGVPDGDGDPEQPGVGTAPVFRILGGQILQWVDGDFRVILSMAVKVTVREFREVVEDAETENSELMGRAIQRRRSVAAPRELVAVRLQYCDPVSAEVMEIRVRRDEWRDHSWLENLPGPVDYDHKRAGLDTVQRAILAVSDAVVDETLYASTGWHLAADGQWRFLHARGGIGSSGHQNLEVDLDGSLQRFDLPDPLTDSGQIRAAFLDHSAGMLEHLPDRVAAPLLGQAYRAVLGRNTWVVTLVGPPGSYKTSVAAKVMHHFGEKWEDKKAASSMSHNGDTFNVVRFKLHHSKDCLYWGDDFAPTKGWLEAQKYLEETTRLVFNQEGRSRSARDGMSISGATPPRASALFTSEVMPRPGSAAERMLVIPLRRGDLDTTQLFAMDEPGSRYGRAVVMASFLRWLAAALPTHQARYYKMAVAYAAQKVADNHLTERVADNLSNMWVGWVAMSDFLADVDAISAEERKTLLVRVNAALLEAAAAAVDPDLPRTTGSRVRELLQYALRQGLAYVDDVRTGDCPPWPMAGRLGWRRQVTEVDHGGHAVRTRVDRMGTRLGYVLHDPGVRDRGRVLMCESAALEAVLKTASATQAEQLQIDRRTAMTALYEDGVLIGDLSEPPLIRHTVHCNIPAENRSNVRMVTLHLDKIASATQAEQLQIDRRTAMTALYEDGVLIGDLSEPPLIRHTVHCNIPAENRSNVRMVTLHLDKILGDDVIDDEDPGPADGPAGRGPDDPARQPTAPAGDPGLADQPGPDSTSLPGLFDERPADPHPLDETQQASVASSETAETGEEAMDVPRWTSRPVTDRDGVVGWTEHLAVDDVAACVICSRRCGVVISGVRVHPPCWEGSTSTLRTRTTGVEAGPTTTPTPDNTGEPAALPGANTAALAAVDSSPAPAPAVDPPGAHPGSAEILNPQPKRRLRAGATSTPRERDGEFKAAAAVAGVDTVWLSNGDQVPMPGTGPRHVGELFRLATWLRLGTWVTDYWSAPGQLWVTNELAERLGLDPSALAAAEGDEALRILTKDQAAVTAALADGYGVGRVDRTGLGQWTRVWKNEETTKAVWVVLLPAVHPDDSKIPLLGGEPEPRALARRLGLLANTLGHPFHLSNQSTGLDLMKAVRGKDREAFFAVHEPCPPATISTGEPDINWCREPTVQEREDTWVHAYDRSGSYLAGISGCELGYGDPVHHPEGTSFAKQVPGYWRVEVPATSGDWRLPHLLDPRGTHAGRTRWVATPGLAFARERGMEPAILEAYIWPTHTRILEPWYARIRDARMGLDVDDVDAQMARDQLKLIYAHTIGMLGSENYMANREGYAPERRHMIVSRARANILRKMVTIGEATGRWPVAIVADTVIYTSSEADPVLAWPGGPESFGRELGRYKVEGSATLESQLQFLTGGLYRGKDALMSRTGGAD